MALGITLSFFLTCDGESLCSQPSHKAKQLRSETRYMRATRGVEANPLLNMVLYHTDHHEVRFLSLEGIKSSDVDPLT